MDEKKGAVWPHQDFAAVQSLPNAGESSYFSHGTKASLLVIKS